jgi:dUTPase
MIVDGGKLLCEVDMSQIYKKYDKIGQLVFAKTIEPTEFEVGALNQTQRGTGGFGSTGS